ncbi:hypothetical protein [Nocardioides pakistanensis]
MSDQIGQPNRVPKGTPTGGRFAATAKAESALTLNPPAERGLGPDYEEQRNASLRGTRYEAEAQAAAARFAARDAARAQEAAREALAPTLAMNRVDAERHVRALIDDAAASGDPQRIDDIASLVSGPGWAGVAYVRGYPGAGNPECEPTDYLKTKAAATRTAEYALSRTAAAERQATEQ